MLEEVLEWYKIRDLLFGENNEKQLICLAFELAKTCNHPEAQWLTKNEKAIRVHPVDLKTEFYHNWLHGKVIYLSKFKILNNGYILSRLASFAYIEEDRIDLLNKSIALGERDAYFQLGDDGNIEYLKIAYSLGHKLAMQVLGRKTDDWKLLGKAAKIGYSFFFVNHFTEVIDDPKKHYIIGRYLYGEIYYMSIFGCKADEKTLQSAQSTVDFYLKQLKFTKSAIFAWSLLATRLGVCKDVRILIGKKIWKTRKEGLY